MKSSLTYFSKVFILVAAIFFTQPVIAKTKIISNGTTDPQETFHAFWKLFNNYYGLFDVKKINWDSVGDVYRTRVSTTTTDEQLYAVFSEMILLLNDNHVNLYPTTGTLPVFPGGLLKHKEGVAVITKAQDDYTIHVAKKYILDWKEVTPNIRYGKLNVTTGYINIGGTDALKTVRKVMPVILTALKGCKGIVVDVRGFYGGMDPVSQYLAGCFADARKPYMITRKRNSEDKKSFTAPINWYVEPQEGAYTGPVLVLSSAFTQSAGETFVLAMHELNNVTVMGDTTAGSYSDNPTFELPNGWMVSLSVGDYRAADGKSYEGVGTAPDVFKKTTRDELLQDRDTLLEQALNFFHH